MNIGSGRIIYQEVTRINNAIEDGSFFTNPVFTESVKEAKKKNGALHLFGLLSDGGIHSHIDHLLALIAMAKKQGMRDVYIHCFADGRDTQPRSLLRYIKRLEDEIARQGIGEIASIIGRFYAMDRDKHWERIKKAYDLMVYGKGKAFTSPDEAVNDSYDQNINDEFITHGYYQGRRQPQGADKNRGQPAVF